MDWISSLLLATVRLAIPVLLISLAELYGQRAGMVNIGLEGLASIGALVGFLVCYVTGSNWLGLLCGALAGVIVNMIYAFSTVTLCADHTVYGMAVNIFAPALASFIYRVYFGTGSDLKQITTMSSVAIPGLKDIPVLGPLLFDQSPMVYLTFLLVLFTAIFFGKTRAGLSYKSVGEHPQADDHRRVLPLADDRRRIVVHIHHILSVCDLNALRERLDAVFLQALEDGLSASDQHDLRAKRLRCADRSERRSLRRKVAAHGVNENSHGSPPLFFRSSRRSRQATGSQWRDFYWPCP